MQVNFSCATTWKQQKGKTYFQHHLEFGEYWGTMESQIQCPVCTLYLHAGMNLQDHLESHPKEKVIAALVNLTLFQQQSNDECNEDYDCNQYETPGHLLETQRARIPPSVATRTYHHQNNHAITSFGGPIQQHSAAQTAHQVMIVDRTRVFHERSNVAINDEGCKRRISTNGAQPKIRTIPVQALQLITTNGLAINQQIQTLRPPPPYCVSVKDNLIRQSGSFFQQNESNSQTIEHFSDELQRNRYPSHELSTATADQYAVNINAVTAFEANEHRKKSTQNIYNADDYLQVEQEDEYDPNEDGKEQHANANTEENLTPAGDTDTHQEATDQIASPSVVAEQSKEEIAGSNFKLEKRTAGLQVISNVKVTPNTVLNMTSLNSQIGDTVSMKDVFIIGAASTSSTSSQKLVSMASTSRAASQIQPCTHNKSNASNITGSKNLLDVSQGNVIKNEYKIR